MERRVRLPAVPCRWRVRREKIGIARDAVVITAAPEDIGVDGRVARAGIEQQCALPAVVEGGAGFAMPGILFAGVVGALALAAGLAFGLGGRETAAEIWEQSYESSQLAVKQLAKSSASKPSGGNSSSGSQDTGSGGGIRVPTAAPSTTRQSTSTSGPEWRTLVTVKLREAREALPETPEGERMGRAIDEMIVRIERPVVAQRVEVRPQPTL